MAIEWAALAALICAANPSAPSAEKPLELEGTVVKAESKRLYVQHEQHIVPLELNASTRINGAPVERSQPLKPGDEVRANYTLDLTQNIATDVRSPPEK